MQKLELPLPEWKSLSHKERRRRIVKTRKKRQRVLLAWRRERDLAHEAEDELTERAREAEEERSRQREEAERELQHAAWVEREKKAQQEFALLREKEERKKREREEREQLIRDEWEALERREKEAEERRNRALKDKEDLLEEALSSIDLSLQSAGHKPEPWHNPLAPSSAITHREPASTEQNRHDYGTEKDVVNCPFYIKTGACRFGDSCSRRHPFLTSGCTLLVRGMYSYMGLSEQMTDEYDQDLGLEHDETDMYEHFKEFYEDVLPEFSSCGTIIQFKVSRNHEAHLRGNVYVQYSTKEECARAMQKFNGRWYASRQLSCHYCHIERWKMAICGLYDRRKCPKGKHCNFLHVFRNPGGAFSWADQDLATPTSHSNAHRRDSLTPRSHRNDWHPYYGHRSESVTSDRHRSRSHSGERCQPSSKKRHRSRSHTRGRHQSQSRDRHRSRSKDRHQSQSRDRHQSRSRDRHRSRSRNRHRSQSRDRHQSQSRDRHRSRSRDRHRSRRKDRHRSCSRERHQSHSRDKGNCESRLGEVRECSRSRSRSRSHSRESPPDSPSTISNSLRRKKRKHSRHGKKHKRHHHQLTPAFPMGRQENRPTEEDNTDLTLIEQTLIEVQTTLVEKTKTIPNVKDIGDLSKNVDEITPTEQMSGEQTS